MKNIIILLIISFLGLNVQAQCIAKINYTIQGDTVLFQGDSSTSANSHTYLWIFGDGTSSTAANPMHIFKNGTFNTCLFIIDSISKCTDTACVKLTVFKAPPCRAQFSWTHITPNGSKPVIWFSDSSYTFLSKFTFGDGKSTIMDGFSSMNISHAYDSGGTYNVCLYVYNLNSKGDTIVCDSICKTVVVEVPKCEANFSHTVSNKTVTFKTSNKGKWIKNTWYFGDGANSSRNIDTNDSYTNHTYAANGTYIVYLYLFDTINSVCSGYMDTIVINDTNTCKAKYTFTVSGDTVTFTNKSTGKWKSERWTMGDGTIIDRLGSPNSTFTYVFKCKGTYSPLLTLYESTDFKFICNSFYDSVITKGAVGCNAKFTYSINKNSVVFTNAATGSYCYEQWFFGDGTATNYARGYANSVTHNYAKVGNYIVCYVLYDNSGICSQICDTIKITQMPSSCKTNFTWYQPECTSEDSIPRLGFTPTQLSIKSIWTFGDGTSMTGVYSQLGHTYQTEGTYKVCLFDYTLDAKKDTVLCDSICINVFAQSYGNIAKISTKISGDTVTLTNLSEGYWDSEYWNFGDGDTSSTFTGKNGTITHVYKNNGTYMPHLVIKNSAKGKLCTYAFDTAYINKPSCQASYYLALDTTTKFNLYVIQNSKGTSSNTSYFWDFGDGDTSHSKSPTHQYKTFGLYNLCLTIKDSSKNCYSTFCDSIGLDSNGHLLKMQGFKLIIFDEKDLLSTSDLDDFKAVNVYPNPSEGNINIELSSTLSDPIEIKTYNSLGQNVINHTYQAQIGKNSFTLDLTKQTPGIYFIHIIQGNQTATKRVLLKSK